MSEKVISVDINTGKKFMKVIIDDMEAAKGKDNVTYSAKSIDTLIENNSSKIITKQW